MKTTSKFLILCLLLIASMLFLTSCTLFYNVSTIFTILSDRVVDSVDKTFIYDAEWIIGKTPEEIQEGYGAFDGYTDNGSDAVGSYKTRKVVSMFVCNRDEYYRIYFDENGIAVRVRERDAVV